MVMAGLSHSLKSSAATFKSSGIFQQGIQVPQIQMASQGVPVWKIPSRIWSRPHLTTVCRVWTSVFGGDWADSLKGKNSLVKLLTSGRPFNPTTWATQTHSTRHRHTDTDNTDTDWLSASHIHLGSRQAQYQCVPRAPLGPGTPGTAGGVQGETGTPPREAEEEGPG